MLQKGVFTVIPKEPVIKQYKEQFTNLKNLFSTIKEPSVQSKGSVDVRGS